jgi:16S rRNA pseudouridine516 synthase
LERIDKVLSNAGCGSRRDVKGLIKDGAVKVDGKIIKDSGMLVDPYISKIDISGETLEYKRYIYLMLNKPAGVVSATSDNYDKTVIDLLKDEDKNFEPSPVGRLDKDTVGLLLITNDGDLNHRLISPKWHVDKVYYAEINKEVSKENIDAFREGIILDDGYKCLAAKLEIIENKNEASKVYVTIHEGKFHQVKRMFEAIEKKVVYLKRIKIGQIALDESLDEGKYRELSKEEIEILKSI